MLSLKMIREDPEQALKIYQSLQIGEVREDSVFWLQDFGKRCVEYGHGSNDNVKVGPFSAIDPKTVPMGSKPPNFEEAKRRIKHWKEQKLAFTAPGHTSNSMGITTKNT